jgi:hypothetical protein
MSRALSISTDFLGFPDEQPSRLDCNALGHPCNPQCLRPRQHDRYRHRWRQFGSTTVAEFFFCLNFIFANPVRDNFRLFHRETSTYVTSASQGLLQLGNYDVVSMSTFPKVKVILLTLMYTDEPATLLVIELIAEDARPRIVSGGTPNSGPVKIQLFFYLC